MHEQPCVYLGNVTGEFIGKEVANPTADAHSLRFRRGRDQQVRPYGTGRVA